jgi:hypothetical protein
MALTIDTLNSLVKEKSIIEGLVSQVYEYNPLMKYFKNGKALVDVSGGRRIMVSIEYGNINGNNWSGAGEIPTGSDRPEFATEAWYDWAFYNASSKIPYKEWVLVEKGAYTVYDFAKKILDILARSVSQDFEKKFFQPWNSATTIAPGHNQKVFGLHQLVTDTDNLKDAADGTTPIYVGDIKISDLPVWKSPVFTYDTNGTLVSNLMHAVNTMTYKWGKPDIALTSQAIYEKYCEDAYNKSAFLIKDEVATSLGFAVGASFNGIPFVFSEDPALANTIYLLNSNYLKFVVHPDVNFKLSPWKQISTTNYDYLATMDVAYSLVVSNRNAQAKIVGVPE